MAKVSSRRPIPLAPQPGIKASATATQQYIGRLFKGSLSIIDLPARKERDTTFAQWTQLAYRCSPLKRDASVTGPPATNSPIPVVVGGSFPSNIASISSKRTGPTTRSSATCRKATAIPSLCLFPEHVTPNHHQLARDFVLLDNFYVEGEVSADGHEWSMGAYATDFVEKMWPLNYGHNKRENFPIPAEGISHRRPRRAVIFGTAPRSRGQLPQLWRVHDQRQDHQPARPRAGQIA